MSETPQHFINEVAVPHVSDECLIWPFGRSPQGYGLVWHKDRKTNASRVVCERAHGPAPTPKHQAAHSCGRGRAGCVNPNHLSWKTPKQNIGDKIIHGTDQRGERSNFAKLTNTQAKEILALKGRMRQRDIADRYGIDQSQVSHIHTGKNWAWL